MSDLLIPFGIHRETGNIVEPEDAETGRACQCLCPGCKAPLLCKHPKEKRDHFAHDSRHENARPQKACPFSSAVAVAMMLREMAPEFVGKLLITPELSVGERCRRCRDYQSILVTHSARNVIDAAEANVSLYGHRVDLKLTVAGFPLLVDLVYKGKPSPSIDRDALQADKVALLELDCDLFSLRALKRNRQIRFSQAILGFFLNAENKRWRFHPRTKPLREQFRQAHQRQCAREYVTIPFKSAKRVAAPANSKRAVAHPRQQTPAPAFKEIQVFNPAASLELITDSMVENRPEREPAPNGDSFHRPRPVIEERRASQQRRPRQKQQKTPCVQVAAKPVIKHFECVLCNLCWEHHGASGWTCPNCESHLYAREITLE